MSPWRQLRWRIVAAQMLVVIVGVLSLIIVADWLAGLSVPAAALADFRAVIGKALATAAIAATLAGLLASLVLVREILRPLRELAQGSRRIAIGHYAERIPVPSSDELADVAASFNQMAEALEHVEQQRVALIGNVSHELRTPLAGLEGYLEGLIDGVLPNDPETFSAMQHEVRRLHRLVDDLQMLSRVEAGQVALQIGRVELAPLIERVVAQLRPQAVNLDLSVQVDAPPNLAAAADSDRVAQILINLIGNAIRYTPEGGHIRVQLGVAEQQALIRVADDGIGISAEALPLLFERFYRVDSSRSRATGGSGIGLTIARHLAWAMGGDLTAASPGAGQGSIFTLTLPLDDGRG